MDDLLASLSGDAARLTQQDQQRRAATDAAEKKAAARRELHEARVAMRSFTVATGNWLEWANTLARYVAAVKAIGREPLLLQWCELLQANEYIGPKRAAILLLLTCRDEQPEAIAAILKESCRLPGMGVLEGSDFRNALDYIGRHVAESIPACEENAVDAHLWQRGEDERAPVPQVIQDAKEHAPATTANAEPSHQIAMTAEAKALATLASHPDWTDEQIAAAAGCNRTSLYRMTKYTQAKAALKGSNSLPRGSKDKESRRIDAWAE